MQTIDQIRKRKNVEAECLVPFDHVIVELGLTSHQGYGADNRFDPGFDLVGQQQFQFGDRRVERPDRTVIVEIESGGGISNLAKYWPQAYRANQPLFLLHGFNQGSANNYISHVRLWDFIWAKMQQEIWPNSIPCLFARRFQYTLGNADQLAAAASLFRACLTLPLDQVRSTIFGYASVAQQH